MVSLKGVFYGIFKCILGGWSNMRSGTNFKKKDNNDKSFMNSA